MKVLELSQTSAAAYAGGLLASLGRDEGLLIDVVRLALGGEQSESPGGELFLHEHKLTLSPASPKRSTAEKMSVADVDIVLEDIGPAGLRSLGWSYRSLRKANPNLIIVSLSPFGLKGAYSDWAGNDFLAQAVGGVIHTCGYEGEAPLALPGEAAYMIAGLHGATAALTAAFEIEGQTDSAGLHIDISAQDTFMQHWTRHVSEYAYSGVTSSRAPRNPEGLHYRHTAMAQDGWLYLLALREPWQDLAAFLGLGDILTPQAWEEGASQPPWGDIDEAFHAAVAGKGKYQWCAEAAELGWTFAPIEDPFEIAASPQTSARGGMAVSSASGAGSRAVDDRAATRGEPLLMPPLPWLCDD